MFPPRAPFFLRAHLGSAEEMTGGNLPVSPYPFHAAFHAASFSRHSSGIVTVSPFS
jgi:hypothetical protein